MKVLRKSSFVVLGAAMFGLLTVRIAWAQTPAPSPSDLLTSLLGTVIGGIVIAGLTEAISNIANSVNATLPSAWKPILAAALAAIVPSLVGLQPFHGVGPWIAVGNALCQFAVGAFLHDIGLSSQLTWRQGKK